MFVTLLEAWNHIRHLPLCRHIFFVEAQLEKSSKGRSEFSCSISEYKSGDTVWSRDFVDIKLLKLLSHLLWPKDDFLAFGGGPLREMRYLLPLKSATSTSLLYSQGQLRHKNLEVAIYMTGLGLGLGLG